VRYVRAILVPEDETCFHVLDAASADIVDGAAREGAVRVERIAEAVEVSRPTLREEPAHTAISTIAAPQSHRKE
jgi:hypothetical protein